MAKAHLHLTIDEDVKRRAARSYPNLSALVEDLLRAYMASPFVYDEFVDEAAGTVAKEHDEAK